jgi:hypothetical protein
MRIALVSVLSVTACTAALAAPIVVQIEPGITNQVEQIVYRRCWWQAGERHCRSVRDGNRIYRYGSGSPEDYRVGTSEWYRAMERDGRLNRPGQGR